MWPIAICVWPLRSRLFLISTLYVIDMKSLFPGGEGEGSMNQKVFYFQNVNALKFFKLVLYIRGIFYLLTSVSCGKEMMKILILNPYFLFCIYSDGGAMDKIKTSRYQAKTNAGYGTCWIESWRGAQSGSW